MRLFESSIATAKVKHDPAYQERRGVEVVKPRIDEALEKRLLQLK